MTNDTCIAVNCAALLHGDLIEVEENGGTSYSGYVEDTLPQIDIVWIRDLRTGERRMLSTEDCRIYRSAT